VEGIAEKLGDVVIDCRGGVPGQVHEGNLTILLPVSVSNRLSGDNTLDATLTINMGAGPVPSVAATPYGGMGVAFNGVRFTIPPSGNLTLRISNLRANVSQFGMTERPIVADLAFNGPGGLAIQNNRPTIALTDRGLRASFSARAIRCVGSPLPATIDISNLLAKGTFYSPARVTEGFPSAFQPRDAASSNGTRIVSRYSGFPAGARIFVPDLIAGSSPDLVALRVAGTDVNGAGGVTVTPGSFGVDTNSVSEIPLANGSGIVVYEIVSANPLVKESFSFPTFVGMPAVSEAAVATQELFFGPLSTVTTASGAAPVPRFTALPPLPDCDKPEDCQPRLAISGGPLQFSGLAGGTAWNPRYIQVRNDNIAVADMPWTVSVAYKNGLGWLLFDPQSGINHATVRFDALMTNLAPGTYEATVMIDAGPYGGGTRTLPVVAVVSGLPPVTPPAQPAPAIVITSVGNAASPWPGAVTAGSLATVKGSKLSGKSVAVTFDSIPATLLYASDSQINLLVPAELASKTKAQMVITVDGAQSLPAAVDLAPVAPAIFENGILNENNTPNQLNSPARVGSAIALWATGLLPAVGQSAVTVKIHDRDNLVPLFAGPAPGIAGVQQVNARIPDDLPAMTTEVVVCAAAGTAPRVCSLPVKLTLSE
jgi:uncharacterized protein (TIGR03437 family)